MRVGFIGWRGMVGSVLMERMQACGDFEGLQCSFFSTSQVGQAGPVVDGQAHALKDAHDLSELQKHDVLMVCQGSSYTSDVYPRLLAAGYDGYWIDADAALRMKDDTVLILDPVNMALIRAGLDRGCKVFCGANCTVSLMLLALHGLFREDLVEWMTSMTYQAASGAGARQMRELVEQMAFISKAAETELTDPGASALAIDARVQAAIRDELLPSEQLGAPLAASLLPWISGTEAGGQSREEWKGFAEGNKILGADPPIPIDGICVRVGSMRCHAQAFTIKLRRDVPLAELEALLDGANDWVRVVENTPAATLAGLTPAAVSGTLDIPVGRIRKLKMGPEYLGAFTVGDQLLWGAAEPLRRMLATLRE